MEDLGNSSADFPDLCILFFILCYYPSQHHKPKNLFLASHSSMLRKEGWSSNFPSGAHTWALLKQSKRMGINKSFLNCGRKSGYWGIHCSVSFIRGIIQEVVFLPFLVFLSFPEGEGKETLGLVGW